MTKFFVNVPRNWWALILPPGPYRPDRITESRPPLQQAACLSVGVPYTFGTYTSSPDIKELVMVTILSYKDHKKPFHLRISFSYELLFGKLSQAWNGCQGPLF